MIFFYPWKIIVNDSLLLNWLLYTIVNEKLTVCCILFSWINDLLPLIYDWFHFKLLIHSICNNKQQLVPIAGKNLQEKPGKQNFAVPVAGSWLPENELINQLLRKNSTKAISNPKMRSWNLKNSIASSANPIWYGKARFSRGLWQIHASNYLAWRFGKAKFGIAEKYSACRWRI